MALKFNPLFVVTFATGIFLGLISTVNTYEAPGYHIPQASRYIYPPGGQPPLPMARPYAEYPSPPSFKPFPKPVQSTSVVHPDHIHGGKLIYSGRSNNGGLEQVETIPSKKVTAAAPSPSQQAKRPKFSKFSDMLRHKAALQRANQQKYAESMKQSGESLADERTLGQHNVPKSAEQEYAVKEQKHSIRNEWISFSTPNTIEAPPQDTYFPNHSIPRKEKTQMKNVQESPKHPYAAPACYNSTFCESAVNYPEDMVNSAIQRNESLKLLESIDQLFGIDRRLDAKMESPLCRSRVLVAYPRSAENINNQWLFVINQPNLRQGIRIELCIDGEDKCGDLEEALPQGYEIGCKQQYIFRELTGVDENGTIVRDSFRFPASCCCHREPDPLFMRPPSKVKDIDYQLINELNSLI